jgi:fermentation-respiration switch protein FrsA (DUF1100 family)
VEGLGRALLLDATLDGVLPIGEALESLRELGKQLLDVITGTMGDGERHEVGNPTKGLAGLDGLLELRAAALRNLGGTNWASPDRTAGHEAVIVGFTVGMTLANIDIGQPIARDGRTKHHALGSASGRDQTIGHGFDGPATGTSCCWGMAQELTGFWIESIGLQAAWILGGRSFGNYTKGRTPSSP